MYRFLPGSDLIQDIPDQLPPKSDAFVVLDTSTRERVGKRTADWKHPVDVVIDHHISNPGFGILNLIVPEIPATAGVLFRLSAAQRSKEEYQPDAPGPQDTLAPSLPAAAKNLG